MVNTSWVVHDSRSMTGFTKWTQFDKLKGSLGSFLRNNGMGKVVPPLTPSVSPSLNGFRVMVILYLDLVPQTG